MFYILLTSKQQRNMLYRFLKRKDNSLQKKLLFWLLNHLHWSMKKYQNPSYHTGVWGQWVLVWASLRHQQSLREPVSSLRLRRSIETNNNSQQHQSSCWHCFIGSRSSNNFINNTGTWLLLSSCEENNVKLH